MFKMRISDQTHTVSADCAYPSPDHPWRDSHCRSDWQSSPCCQVENLGAELESFGLRNLEALDQRHVQLHQPVTTQRVPPQVPIGELRGQRKGIHLARELCAAGGVRRGEIPEAQQCLVFENLPTITSPQWPPNFCWKKRFFIKTG